MGSFAGLIAALTIPNDISGKYNNKRIIIIYKLLFLTHPIIQFQAYLPMEFKNIFPMQHF